MPLSDQTRLLLLVGLLGLLTLVEGVVPLFRYPRSRIWRAIPNLGLTILVVATNLALSFMAVSVADLVARQRFGLLYLADLPEWLKFLIGAVILDFCAYLAHVLLHRYRFGWRFHRVHHSEPEVDATTALRQHPVESLWRIAWQFPAIGLLGLPITTVSLYLVMSAANAQLEHANIRIPESVDRLLRWILVTPNMHKVHHSRLQAQTDTNYSNILSVWDRLFRTYREPERLQQIKYGLEGFDDPRKQTLASLLIEPFLRS